MFEAVNRCLYDLMQTTILCSGRIFVCCGDFRQIPPVIPGGGRHAIIEATIKSSPLWPMFAVRELSRPQRDAGDTRYSNFVDRIGDGGLLETYSTATITGLVNLEVMAVTTDEDAAINFVFPNIDDVLTLTVQALHSLGMVHSLEQTHPSNHVLPLATSPIYPHLLQLLVLH